MDFFVWTFELVIFRFKTCTPTLSKKTPIKEPLGRPTTLVGPGSWSLGDECTNYIGLPRSSIQILDHFSMATPSPPHRAPSSVWFYNHFSPPPLCDPGVLDHLSMGPIRPQQCFLDRGSPMVWGGVNRVIREWDGSKKPKK